MSFIIEKEEIEMDEPDNNDQATATAGETDTNDETETNEPETIDQQVSSINEPEIIIKEKKKYSFTPARAKALAKGRLTRANNLAINKLKVNKVNEENEKNRLMKLISEMNLVPAKHKKKTRYIESETESESDNEDNDNNLPYNNYNTGYF